MNVKPSPLALVCFVLILASQTALARSIPWTPVPLTPADRQAVLDALGLDETQIRSIRGFRFDGHPPSSVTVQVEAAGEVLAAGVESGRRLTCFRSESIWTCDLEAGTEMLLVGLPEDCPAPVVPGHETAVLPILRNDGPSVPQALALAETICTSERIAEEAWALGHRVSMARRNVDDQIEIWTAAPPSYQQGLVFVLREQCQGDSCRFVVAERHGRTP